MKSPQLENGYTPLANELLEALLLYKFTLYEYKVIMAVVRLTYGYHRKMAQIGNSRLALMTNIERNHVGKIIRRLDALNVLVRDTRTYVCGIGLNKNYWEWGITQSGDTHSPVYDQSGDIAAPVGFQSGDSHAPGVGIPMPHLSGQSGDTQASLKIKVKESEKKTPLPQVELLAVGAENENFSGGGDFGENLGCETHEITKYALIFPRAMSQEEQIYAETMLEACGLEAQSVVDVLAAALKAGRVQTSALALLSGLVRRFKAGSFDAAPGLKIKIEREKTAQMARKEKSINRASPERNLALMAQFKRDTHLR